MRLILLAFTILALNIISAHAQAGEETGGRGGAAPPIPESIEAPPESKVTTPTTDQAQASSFLEALPAGAQYYICPMHPEVVSEKPDKCPKCNMHLQRATRKSDPGPVHEEQKFGDDQAAAPGK